MMQQNQNNCCVRKSGMCKLSYIHFLRLLLNSVQMFRDLGNTADTNRVKKLIKKPDLDRTTMSVGLRSISIMSILSFLFHKQDSLNSQMWLLVQNKD